MQLAVGTEERHHLVVVKPRGTGSEFAVVFVQTDETQAFAVYGTP